MKRRLHSPEQVVQKLRDADTKIASGATVEQVCKEMGINADTGLITGTSDGTGGTVTVSVTLTKEHRLVHDKDNIVWGNEHEQSRTYESVGPVIQQFILNGTKDK